MSGLVVLIVPENDRQFSSLSKAIRGVGVGEVHQARGAEGALHWLGLYKCDACVISYELPGKRNGIETLLDIRNHRPDLPLIMVSSAKSEKVAVDAFHAGVVDYVPTTRGYEHAVASLISQLKVSQTSSAITPAQIIPPDVDERLLQPTYQNKLRTIGRHLDLYGFRRINVLEVDGGFIVRATPTGDRGVETLEFVNQQFAQLIAAAASRRSEGDKVLRNPGRLLPTGYEDFLRAVGNLLDQHAAEAVTISELEEIAVVGGVGRVDETGVSRYGPIQWLFRTDDVAVLLDEAYQRRHNTAGRKPHGVKSFLGRR